MKLIQHLLVFCIVTAGASAQELSPVHIHFQKRIPNAEGIELSANIYLPANTSERNPALLALTPYGVDNMHADAMWYARRGYAVVIADCRGRGNSEGRFVPFEYDGSDAYDICRWIGKQEWSNGKVGMFGGSYLGMIQWLAMAYRPKELRTIVPTAAVAPGIDFPFFNNIFYTYNAQWLALTLGRTTAMNAFH
ncbi:MAG: hypothetical protein CL946_03480, partial [Ectothiorhodospiraceae bacterium]|nr:hypothetical protein [Ectothiorhodospiraceae bacterium]